MNPSYRGRTVLFLLMGLLASQAAAACQINVFAAASLTHAFSQIAQRFTAQHQCTVVLNFAASGTLVQQLRHGAPADVLATADQVSMDLAEQLQLITPPSRRNFTRNRLVLIIPAAPQSLADSMDDDTAAAVTLSDRALQRLTAPEIRQIAIGNAASVPAGRYAQAALQRAGIWQTLSPKMIPALHVRQVLDYVSRGEVDAGFVYASDARGQPVQVLGEIRTDEPILYPAAISATSSNPAAARWFVDFLLTAPAQQILHDVGFHTDLQGPAA